FHSAVAEDKTQITIGLTNEHSPQRQSEIVITFKISALSKLSLSNHVSSNRNYHFPKAHLLIFSRPFFVVLHPIETADDLRQPVCGGSALLTTDCWTSKKHEHLSECCY